MANDFRNALTSVQEQPISHEAVLLTLAYIGKPAPIHSITALLGEDSTCQQTISRVAAAVQQLVVHGLVQRDPQRERVVSLTKAGARQELQIRENMIRKSYRAAA